MKKEYNNEGALYDTRYSNNDDVKCVQELLRAGGCISTVYDGMGFAHKYASQIIRYLRYREWHIYDDEIMEFEVWKENGEPRY